MHGTKGIWEGRATDSIRFTFEKIDGGIFCGMSARTTRPSNVGEHSAAAVT